MAMNLIKLIATVALCVVVVSAGSHRRHNGRGTVRDTDVGAVVDNDSSEERTNSSCNQVITKCLHRARHFSELCFKRQNSSRRSPAFDECIQQDDIKTAFDESKAAATRFHDNLKKCLAGEAPPAEVTVTETDAEELDGQDERDVDELDEHINPHALVRIERSPRRSSNKTKKCGCLKRALRLKAYCLKKMKHCQSFRECYGVGEEPEDPVKQEWFELIKSQREDARTQRKDSFKKLVTCIRSHRPVDVQPALLTMADELNDME